MNSWCGRKRRCLRKELDDMMQGITCIMAASQTLLLIYTCCFPFIAIACPLTVSLYAMLSSKAIVYALVCPYISVCCHIHYLTNWFDSCLHLFSSCRAVQPICKGWHEMASNEPIKNASRVVACWWCTLFCAWLDFILNIDNCITNVCSHASFNLGIQTCHDLDRGDSHDGHFESITHVTSYHQLTRIQTLM